MHIRRKRRRIDEQDIVKSKGIDGQKPKSYNIHAWDKGSNKYTEATDEPDGKTDGGTSVPNSTYAPARRRSGRGYGGPRGRTAPDPGHSQEFPNTRSFRHWL